MIRREDYGTLLETIDATGNVYTTNITILRIDENPSKKTSTDANDRIKIGENIYYVQYTAQIEDEFDKTPDGIIRLRGGDFVKVDIANENKTMYELIQGLLYNVSGGKVGRISGEHTALIIESTRGKMATEVFQ